jgi:hypothetical protein
MNLKLKNCGLFIFILFIIYSPALSEGIDFVNERGTAIPMKILSLSDNIYATKYKYKKSEVVFKLEILKPYFVIAIEDNYYKIIDQLSDKGQIGYVHKNYVTEWNTNEGLRFIPNITNLSDGSFVKIWKNLETIHKYIATRSEIYRPDYIENKLLNSIIAKKNLPSYPIIKENKLEIEDDTYRKVYKVIFPVYIGKNNNSFPPYQSVFALKAVSKTTIGQLKKRALENGITWNNFLIEEGWMFEKDEFYQKNILIDKENLEKIIQLLKILSDSNLNRKTLIANALKKIEALVGKKFSKKAEIQKAIEKQLGINFDFFLLSFSLEWFYELPSEDRKEKQKLIKKIAEQLECFFNKNIIKLKKYNQGWMNISYFSPYDSGYILSCFSSNNTTSLITFPINRHDAKKIGQKILFNETGGKIENLIHWADNTSFLSLGLGHFIWYPKGQDGHFKETFPNLVKFLKSKNIPLPNWLNSTTDNPWNTYQHFIKNRQSEEMVELQNLLINTFPEQIEFIIYRFETSLPKILNFLSTDSEREYVRKQFYRLSETSAGLYALIDYVNFKGEGISPQERYNGNGWGLLQVLLEMRDNSKDAVKEFADAAKFVLWRRIENSPKEKNEIRWFTGWKKRVNTYRYFHK